MAGTLRQKFERALRKFRRDESGMALIYVTIALPVIIGFSLLAIDVGRLTTLQSSLQNGADALALAGAGELDRRPDAIVRANRAIDNLITSNQSQDLFVATAVTIDENSVSRRYLRTLPALDSSPILAANVTTDPVEARFVEVTVTPVNFNTIFPATFIGGSSNTKQSAATAVAGFDAAVCAFTPLFMCNPFEPATGTTDPLVDYGLFTHVASTATKRRLIEFKAHDNNAQWSPGNYGFLEANAGPGAKALGVSIASTVPEACFIQNGVHTKPGNTTVTKDAFNVRFDLYKGSYGKNDYPPAKNVRKGYYIKPKQNGDPGNACNDNELRDPVDLSKEMGLPRDSCFQTNSCTLANGRMGDGDWGGDTAGSVAVPDFVQYWQINHPGKAIPTNPETGLTYTNAAPPTRYDIYRMETEDADLLDDVSAGGTETGLPVCSAGNGTDVPDRRIIYGAILNCRGVGLDGGTGGPYQAVAFGKYFMTEPMGNPPDSTLWAELIDIVEPGQANSVARDIVQLYR